MKKYILFWYFLTVICKLLYSSKQFGSSSLESKKEHKNNGVNNCVLKCKDEHMRAMGSEWTADFAFPLLGLVNTNSSIEIAQIKAQEICYENDNLEKCLKRCPKSDERKLLLLGLKPWEDVCRNLKQLKLHFTCWRKNIESLAVSCRSENSILISRLRDFSTNRSLPFVKIICSSFNNLSNCSLLDYQKYCGNGTTKLLKKFYQTSKYAVNEMLKVKFTTLPEECENDMDKEWLRNFEQNSCTKKLSFQFLSFLSITFCILLYIS
uniref:CPG4 domain-containing protein n=1 Tax=Strongyloides papillosus TaxID=174720 RepID=A0A0N5C1G8_STREA